MYGGTDLNVYHTLTSILINFYRELRQSLINFYRELRQSLWTVQLFPSIPAL